MTLVKEVSILEALGPTRSRGDLDWFEWSWVALPFFCNKHRMPFSEVSGSFSVALCRAYALCNISEKLAGYCRRFRRPQRTFT